MNLNELLKKAWDMLWNYRALWLFGAILALVGASAIFPPSWPNWEKNDQWTRIVLNDRTTLKIPGADVTLDLTAPGGFRIITPDGNSWREFNELVDVLEREVTIDLWPILIELAAIVVCLFLLGLIARYVSETALIRMVDEAEATGGRISIWGGFRRGFSIRAWRLFLLDLLIGVLCILLFGVGFGLSAILFLMQINDCPAFLNITGLGMWGFILLEILLWIAIRAVLSLVVQPIRRACALEMQSLLASIRLGARFTLQHFSDLAPLWLVWLSLRLLWVLLAVPLLILFAPFLLLTIPLGTLLGGASTALVAAFAYLFMDGATPWILGAMVGLPILIVVMISPILFVSGLVEIYMSSIWTLAYGDLKAMELPAQVPVSQAQVLLKPELGLN